MIKYDEQKLRKALIVWGTLFTLTFITGVIIMAIGPTIEGHPSEHLSQILKNPLFYQIGFILAALTGPLTSVVMIVLALFVKTKKDTPILNILCVFFLSPYLIFESVAYFSQSTYFISLLYTDLKMAEEWYFGNFYSLCYFIQQLGYLFFAVSGILLGYRFCFDKGIKMIFGFFIEIRCLFTIIAFVGLIMRNREVNAATFVSGSLTLLLGLFAILIGITDKRTETID